MHTSKQINKLFINLKETYRSVCEFSHFHIDQILQQPASSGPGTGFMMDNL